MASSAEIVYMTPDIVDYFLCNNGNEPFTVVFIKKNGTLRTIHCRALGLGPYNDILWKGSVDGSTDSYIDPFWNGDCCCVVTDRDCDEVRSFNMDRVLSICDTSVYMTQTNTIKMKHTYNINSKDLKYKLENTKSRLMDSQEIVKKLNKDNISLLDELDDLCAIMYSMKTNIIKYRKRLLELGIEVSDNEDNFS